MEVFKPLRAEIDYSVDPESGKWIFTSSYLLERGSCCKSGCENCPYGNSPIQKRLDGVKTYHQYSKHHFHRYAPGPGAMDWENQPNPYRTYDGAPVYGLTPFSLENSLKGRPEPLSHDGLSQFLQDSLGLSAWKSYHGNNWALRMNPSSGNLHPTEAYLVSGAVSGLEKEAAVYHYMPKEHALEVRVRIPESLWETISAALPAGSFLIGLSSIHWREAWKYGERAYRYCQHDLGHAIGALFVSAETLGWSLSLLDTPSTEDLLSLLGLFGVQTQELEEPGALLLVRSELEVANDFCSAHWSLDSDTSARLRKLKWLGTPNALSPAHMDWPMIENVNLHCRKVQTPVSPPLVKDKNPIGPPVSFRKFVHQRRSAVEFDGQTSISVQFFYDILEKICRLSQVGLPWPNQVHLALFVHRVEGLSPGLYFLGRNDKELSHLKGCMRPEFLWEKPEVPLYELELEFYRLLSGDVRSISKNVSCHQDIASDGCFSLGMIASFTKPLSEFGPWFYRRLFWECGVIGQILYLEAESKGLRATGIGCFFDDVMHQILGFDQYTNKIEYQSLYHFTVGGPIEDSRLSSSPAYPVL